MYCAAHRRRGHPTGRISGSRTCRDAREPARPSGDPQAAPRGRQVQTRRVARVRHRPDQEAGGVIRGLLRQPHGFEGLGPVAVAPASWTTLPPRNVNTCQVRLSTSAPAVLASTPLMKVDRYRVAGVDDFFGLEAKVIEAARSSSRKNSPTCRGPWYGHDLRERADVDPDSTSSSRIATRHPGSKPPRSESPPRSPATSPTPTAPRLRGPRPCCCRRATRRSCRPGTVATQRRRSGTPLDSPRRGRARDVRRDDDGRPPRSCDRLEKSATNVAEERPARTPYTARGRLTTVVRPGRGSTSHSTSRIRSARPTHQCPAVPRLEARARRAPRSPATSPTPTAPRLRGPRRGPGYSCARQILPSLKVFTRCQALVHGSADRASHPAAARRRSTADDVVPDVRDLPAFDLELSSTSRQRVAQELPIIRRAPGTLARTHNGVVYRCPDARVHRAPHRSPRPRSRRTHAARSPRSPATSPTPTAPRLRGPRPCRGRPSPVGFCPRASRTHGTWTRRK